MNKLIENLKIGDFVEGAYKYGAAQGIVKKILKNTVVVSKHEQYYNTFTNLGEDLNISKTRIMHINRPGIILK